MPQEELITETETLRQKTVWAFAFIAALAAFLVYLPALQNGFVNWDDDLYVYNNADLLSKTGPDFIRWCFTAVVAALWHPLTLISLAIDYHFWGLDAKGFHLTNNILHALNTGLVFILTVQLMRLSKVKIFQDRSILLAGAVTALLFGLHPVHVESVAWVSERKDVLCAFFYLSALIAYLKYSSAGSKRALYYSATLLLFISALMSKPMAVSLPFVLLIFHYYLFADDCNAFKKSLPAIIPFFVLSISISILTLYAHESGNALFTQTGATFLSRTLIAARSYIFYLIKIALPLNLAPLYPYPKAISFFSTEYIGAMTLFTALSYYFIFIAKNKFLPALWLFYVITLIPVIGIVQVGDQTAADRYTYLPGIAPFFLTGVGISRLFQSSKHKRYALTFAVLFCLCVLSLLTFRQINHWRDSIALWSHELSLFPSAGKAYFNRGAAYNVQGKYNLAISDYDKGIALNPKDGNAYYNRGYAYEKSGAYNKAINDYSKAIMLRSNIKNAYINRALAYNKIGKNNLAIIDLKRVIMIDQNYGLAYYNLGYIYSKTGNKKLSRYYYEMAAKTDKSLF